MTVELVTAESFQIGGEIFRQNKTIEGDYLMLVDEEIPAAKTGTLTVRTDANTGSLTMTAGHGITTGQRLDLYWSGGCRRGVVVGTVATNVVPIDLGAGDDLPIATTVITAMVPLEKSMTFTGDNAIALLAHAAAKGIVVFADAADAELGFAVITVDANNRGIWSWTTGNSFTNPLAGDAVAKVFMSHGDSTGTKNVKVGVLLP